MKKPKITNKTTKNQLIHIIGNLCEFIEKKGLSFEEDFPQCPYCSSTLNDYYDDNGIYLSCSNDNVGNMKRECGAVFPTGVNTKEAIDFVKRTVVK